MKLSAHFSMPVMVMIGIRDIMDKRTSSTTIADIRKDEETDGTIVEGPAQDVMFLIGDVASHGFNNLTEVHQVA